MRFHQADANVALAVALSVACPIEMPARQDRQASLL